MAEDYRTILEKKMVVKRISIKQHKRTFRQIGDPFYDFSNRLSTKPITEKNVTNAAQIPTSSSTAVVWEPSQGASMPSAPQFASECAVFADFSTCTSESDELMVCMIYL